MDSLRSGHWREHARQWSYVGPPLRPVAEDIAAPREALAEWLRASGRDDPSLLVLGVTPELCGLPAGARARVVGLDNSPDMIRAIWPGRSRPRDAALCGDWLRMPVRSATIDLAFADGSFSALPYPRAYASLCAELARVLRSGGRVSVRCFVAPDSRESAAEVFADLERGAIGNFHVLKWRLAMALQPDAASGVAVGAVWQALHGAYPDQAALAARCSWPLEEVRTIEVYRGVETRYTFPTLDEYRGVFASAGFAVIRIATPSYELGARCPTLLLERSGAARA